MIRLLVLIACCFVAGASARAGLLPVVDVIGSPPAADSPSIRLRSPGDGPPVRAPEPASQDPAAASNPPPAPLSSCDAGGCWDSRGQRYDATGDGARYLDSRGRLCIATGKFIRCN